jgi:hypothetical protein
MSGIADLEAENARLKAEVERLTAFTTRTIIPNDDLKAQVDRLTRRCSALREAGDDLWYCIRHRDFDPDATETWQEVRDDLKR